MSEQIVKVPDLGGTDSVEVIEICVGQGDVVEEGQSLVVVESDKASMDIPSPFSGTIEKLLVSEGASISEGDSLVAITAAGSGAPTEPALQKIEAETQESAAQEAAPAEPAVAAPATNAPSEPQKVPVPDLGGADSVEVIEVCVSPGDQLQEGDSVIVLESDKASMDMPAPFSGEVVEVLVETGASVSEGDNVLVMRATEAVSAPVQESPAKQSAAAPEPATQAPQAVSAPSKPQQQDAKPSNGGVHAGPAVRKLARELGVDLSKVTATGPKGRVSKEDLHAYVKDAVNKPASGIALPDAPKVDFAKFGEIDAVAMTKMQKVTAANMQRSWLSVPHVTHFDNADITELEEFRASLKPEMQARGVKISPVAFLVKAVAATLAANPILNSSIGADGESLVFKKYIHIGMAVDTEHGLLVPVIRNADQKGLWELAEDITELAGKAKSRKLRPDDMQGASFTISSLGAIGGTGFTPIVNTPEVGILGVSNTEIRPVYKDGQFEPRKMMPLALSYDHRVVNGGDAGRFMTTLAALMGDMRRILL